MASNLVREQIQKYHELSDPKIPSVFWHPKLIFVFHFSVTKQHFVVIQFEETKIAEKMKKLDPPKKVVVDLQKKSMGLILYGKIPM